MSTDESLPDAASIPPYSVGRPDDSRPYRDLCSTCNNAGACSGRSTPEYPIFFCEEFDAFVPVLVAKLAAAVSPRPKRTLGTCERVGLCMNCDNVETCTWPTPEGGVWHCEEYR